MKPNNFDFGGYVTKVNLKCADGRIILKDAFKDNDGETVPLVWQHIHGESFNVLGHAVLENRDDGVYAFCTFNDTPTGQNAKLLVEHGDITALSIYANGLVEKAKAVAHGIIREVSLVLAGANPGAIIDFLTVSHSDGSTTDLEDEAIVYTGLSFDLEKKEDILKHEDASDKEETVEDVFNTLSEKQKTVVYALVSQVMAETDNNVEHSDKEGDKDNTMKHNVFEKKGKESYEGEKNSLTHDQFTAIVEDAKKMGSFKESFLKHQQEYGIENIDVLFPDAQSVTGNVPVFVTREMAWVAGVISGTRHSPFSRIKSSSADITVETARALGYVKGELKKEEVFALLTRTTTPTTIYKKQKLDRDDIVDITDMDVVVWLKSEMRMMLDEEIARAVLVGDGRAIESLDKITETNVRPIYTDDEFYTHRVQVESDATIAEIEEAIIRGRSNYKGSGSPVMYTTTTFLTDLLLQKDGMDRRMYSTEAELAAALRVSKIVEVPVMDGLEYEVDETMYDLKAIIVNLKDYVLGADKGGQVSMFDDFDIDYNQYKYLLETRISGALVLPKSALVVEQEQVVGPF